MYTDVDSSLLGMAMNNVDNDNCSAFMLVKYSLNQNSIVIEYNYP
jgi:hypothetical protein